MTFNEDVLPAYLLLSSSFTAPQPHPDEFSTRTAVSNVQMPSHPLSTVTDYGKQSQLARVVLNVFFRQHGFFKLDFHVKQFSSSQEKS